MLRSVSTGNDEIIRKPDKQKHRKRNNPFVYNPDSESCESHIYQDKVDNLQKPIPCEWSILLPLIFYMDELAIHAASNVSSFLPHIKTSIFTVKRLTHWYWFELELCSLSVSESVSVSVFFFFFVLFWFFFARVQKSFFLWFRIKLQPPFFFVWQLDASCSPLPLHYIQLLD